MKTLKKPKDGVACPFCGKLITDKLPEGLSLKRVIKTFKEILKAYEKAIQPTKKD